MRAWAAVAAVVLAGCGGGAEGDPELRAHLVQSGMSEDIVDCVVDRADFTDADRAELLSVEDVDDLGRESEALGKVDLAVVECL